MTATPPRARSRAVALALVLLLALLAVLAWYVLRSGDVAPSAPPPQPRAAPTQHEGEAPDDEPPAQRRHARVEPPSAPAQTPDAAPSEHAADTPAQPAPGADRRSYVVDTALHGVAGAHVTVRAHDDADAPPLYDGVTDDAGFFAAGIDPSAVAHAVDVLVTDTWGRVHTRTVPKGERWSVVIARAPLRGRVVEPGGRGVAGALVTGLASPVASPFGPPDPDMLRALESLHESEGGVTAACVMTDAGGAFELRGLPLVPATVTATTSADARAGARVAVAADVAPDTAEIELVLGPSRRIEGRVTDEAGEPIAGNVRVVMRGAHPGGDDGAVWSPEGSVRDDGTFAIADTSPANTLWAWVEGETEYALTILRDVPPGGPLLDVHLKRGVRTEAVAVGADGAPLAGMVQWYVLTPEVGIYNGGNANSPNVRTHPLPYDLVFDLVVFGTDGRYGILRRVRAGQTGLRVPTAPLAPITGRVVLQDGSAAPEGTVVRGWIPEVRGRRRVGLEAETTVDADGRFTLPPLADLGVLVWAEPRAGAGPAAAPGRAAAGDDVRITLPPGAALEGVVAHADGRAAPSVELWIVPSGDVPWARRVAVDGEGRFRADGLPLETLRIVQPAAGEDAVRLSVTPPDHDVRIVVRD